MIVYVTSILNMRINTSRSHVTFKQQHVNSLFFIRCYEDNNHSPHNKNMGGDLSDNNYPPIALATIASKLFESLILSRISTFFTTCVNQFGFKKHHSTECSYFGNKMGQSSQISLGPAVTP